VVPREQRPRPRFLAPAADPKLAGYRTLEEETVSGYGEIASVERDPVRGRTRVTAPNAGATEFPWGTQRYRETIVHEATDGDPAATSVRGEYAIEVKLKDRTLAWESTVEFRSDRENFHYSNHRRLRQDGGLVREKSWKQTIPRDHQ
jgi:hypothetical protein